jgi:hypothetical protein
MYSLHLSRNLSRAGVRLTILGTRRASNRAHSAAADGIEWLMVPQQGERQMGGRLAVRSLFSRLPNVATQYNTVSFRRALRAQMARD